MISIPSSMLTAGSARVHPVKYTKPPAIKTLQERPFFAHYREKTRFAGGDSVEVLPLEIVAETKAFSGA